MVKNKKIKISKIPLRREWRGCFDLSRDRHFHTCLGIRVSRVKSIFREPVKSFPSALVEGRNRDNRHSIPVQSG